MKLYKMKINGLETTVQLTEEDAKRFPGLHEVTEVGDADLTLADNRAPSAKLEEGEVGEDEYGRPLVRSAHDENEQRLARKRAAAAAAKKAVPTDVDDAEEVEAKAATARNKARAAENK